MLRWILLTRCWRNPTCSHCSPVKTSVFACEDGQPPTNYYRSPAVYRHVRVVATWWTGGVLTVTDFPPQSSDLKPTNIPHTSNIIRSRWGNIVGSLLMQKRRQANSKVTKKQHSRFRLRSVYCLGLLPHSLQDPHLLKIIYHLDNISVNYGFECSLTFAVCSQSFISLDN